MDFENFVSGKYNKQFKYKSFEPAKINRHWLWKDPLINVLLEEAVRKLGEFNAFSLIVPDVDLFIKMHILKEANTSSRIEGTETEIDEVLRQQKDIDPEKRDDWQEVQNYVKAMNYAIYQLHNLPLSNRLLKNTHKILLENSRGKHKLPGEFRKSQNWIGGSNLTDAVFVPPHNNDIAELMSDLENFWHNEELSVPHLIKIAISHYQFETIHPFLDGNGRIGRLLITLYLVYFNLLAKPSLYLSDYFETYRTSYFDALSRVRESNDIIHWIKFFLNAVIHTSEIGKKTFEKILKLRQETDDFIIKSGRISENMKFIVNHFYKKPVLTVKEISMELQISERTTRNIIAELLNKKIIEELTGNKRNRIFVFEKYLNLFKDKS
ncbi:MAG: Fic family protein [Candidatus Cloacimonetes bacterium]|nr:Fic family protein [Candidatus Cloacimonadota bacterium]